MNGKQYVVHVQVRKCVDGGGSVAKRQFDVGPVNEMDAQWIVGNLGTNHKNNDTFFHCTYEELNLIPMEDFLEMCLL